MIPMKKIVMAATALLSLNGLAIASVPQKADPLDDFVKIIQESDIARVEYMLDARNYSVAEFDTLIDAADKVVAEKNSCKRSGWNWFKLYLGGSWFFLASVSMFNNRTTALQDANFLKEREAHLTPEKFADYEKELKGAHGTIAYAQVFDAVKKLKEERAYIDRCNADAASTPEEKLEKLSKYYNYTHRWDRSKWILNSCAAALAFYIGYRGLRAPYDIYARAKVIANGLRQAQEFARTRSTGS